MTNEKVMQLIREAREKNLKNLDLSGYQLIELPQEIGELKNLTTLDLSNNQLIKLPTEIFKLENLTKLKLSSNLLTQLPPEIGKFKELTTLDVSHNQLTQLPPEIGELNNLITLNLSENELKQLPFDIKEIKKLTSLNLSYNRLEQFPQKITKLINLMTLNLHLNSLKKIPPEIGELKNLTSLDLSENYLHELPPEIGELKNLTSLDLGENRLDELPPEIGELKNLTKLDLYGSRLKKLTPRIRGLKQLSRLILTKNQLTELPPEIGELENLTTLELNGGWSSEDIGNWIEELPAEIGKLKNLTKLSVSYTGLKKLTVEIRNVKNLRALDLSFNYLTELPPEIIELNNLTTLNLSDNPLISPPPEIVSRGLEAVFTYLKQSKTTENHEAKLILVGDGEVGKTCLAYRLINNEFLGDSKVTERINISKWNIQAPNSIHSDIKLNIWDFGGQEIYHATHQLFLTKRSIYLLVWNARKSKNFDNIYYWLHIIEVFGEDSPIILVMSKMNEYNDDLNLKDLKSKFPQIVDNLKIDSSNGRGIDALKDTICRTAWNLPLMRTKWVDSWFKVRQRLEDLKRNWVSYDLFYKICTSEGLDVESINVLDDYLNDLGVTLHFKDRLVLKDMVILNPLWAIEAFYDIFHQKSLLKNEGALSLYSLSKIWNNELYPSSVHPQLMELMNRFELAYELPDKKSYLIPEMLPKNVPDDFTWDVKDNLCFYYSYDYFLPPGIIPRFIVRMHQDIQVKKNGMPFCWREGVVLTLQNSQALVRMNPEDMQIEVRVKGDNKRGAMGAICSQFDQINSSMKKIKVSKQIPCNCSEKCSERYPYDMLLEAERNNVETIQCHKSFKSISVSLLLDGYKKREERFGNMFEYDVFICHSSKDKSKIEEIIRDFKKEGITYWVDEEQIDYGDQITQKIEEGLQNSKYVIPCLSKNLKTSGWTRAEYGAILNAEFSGNSERMVIPLKLDNCEDKDIPHLLRDKKRVTYSDKTDFNKFIKSLKSKKLS